MLLGLQEHILPVLRNGREAMNRKKILGLCISMLFVIMIFAGITVVVTVTTEPATAGEMVDRSKSQNKGTSEGDKKAAETLIDKTVSREEIEETAGKWTEFELDGNGCERGVYAGKFYYEDFMIYSRTYDKGKTFHIMSVN